MEPVRVSLTEFERNLGRYRTLALSQPVAVIGEGQSDTVLISATEYQRLVRRDRQVMGLDDFTAQDVEALGRAMPPPEAAAFDHEVKS